MIHACFLIAELSRQSDAVFMLASRASFQTDQAERGGFCSWEGSIGLLFISVTLRKTIRTIVTSFVSSACLSGWVGKRRTTSEEASRALRVSKNSNAPSKYWYAGAFVHSHRSRYEALNFQLIQNIIIQNVLCKWMVSNPIACETSLLL